MKRTTIVASLLSLVAVSSEARADVVSDRVLLTNGVSTCGTNAQGFRRIKQMPDGSQTLETTEFQVPSGSYLEITSVEYATPYWTPWAKTYVQYLDVSIRQRSSTVSTSVLFARYMNKQVFSDDANGNYVAVGDIVAPGAETHHAAFPVGPLMSPAGRLCASASSNFWTFQGSVRIRGRLIPSGEPATTPPPGGVAQ